MGLTRSNNHTVFTAGTAHVHNEQFFIIQLKCELFFPVNEHLCVVFYLTKCGFICRSPPQRKCSAAMALWCPTATAPAITPSQTTSSSACPVSGRTPRPARPFSSQLWTRACWKSGNFAIGAVLQWPNRLTAAREPVTLLSQGSKPLLCTLALALQMLSVLFVQ